MLPAGSLWSRVRRIVLRVIGAPDYDHYVRHMTQHRPECALLSKKEFERDRLNARYSNPGSRCC